MRVGAILLLIEILAAAPVKAVTFSEAKSEYDRNHVAEAQRMFASVASDSTALASDRSAAERELARIAWLIDGDSKRALQHLDAARSTGGKPCETSAMTARVLRESKQLAEAIGRSEPLLSACPEPSERDAIRVHLVGARLDLAATNVPERPRLLADAVAESARFTPEAGLEAARVRLETALLTNNAAGAIAGWKDYFWLDDTDAPQALEKVGATAIFTKGLRADASVADRLQLAELLMRAGFGTQSRRFADAHQLPALAASDPTMKRLKAYWSSREALEAALLSANRHMARGGKTGAVLKTAGKDLDRADAAWTKSLVNAAGKKGEPDAIILKAYGILGTGRGTTSGYPSIHRGHLVEDRHLVIRQYGREAKIHYMSVDNMLGNGFESWLWDGGPMVGGWQANGVIVNVRPGYVNSPLRAYRISQDTPARRELIEREKPHANEDLAKLKSRPVATLDGLNDRLKFQVIDQIMASARSKAPDEASIRRAFLAEYSRANFNQSILTHEGRHAIDETMGLSDKVEQPVLEYQAKLSELALALYPRMAMQNLNLNLEGDGPHDKAGAKVFDEYRKWMEAHTDQIMGYDQSLPALVQLDKLSDEQIREIARDLDPLANGRPSPTKL